MDNQDIIKAFEGNPFALLCGMKLVEQEDGSFIMTAEIKTEYKNVYGYVHGGYLFSIADTIGGHNARRFLQQPVTLNSDFHFIANTQGGTITATAKIVSAGRKIAVVHVEIFSEDNRLLCEGDFTYYNIAQG